MACLCRVHGTVEATHSLHMHCSSGIRHTCTAHTGWSGSSARAQPRKAACPAIGARGQSALNQRVRSGHMAQAGGCSGPTPYNFGKAAADDAIVHGSARAGAKSTRGYSPDLRVTAAEVSEWVDFMKAHGIQRVVSMLAADELETYAEPLPAAMTAAFGEGKYINVDPKASPEELPAAVIEALQAADAAGEKVVVHCWGGGGRTGLALAAWLVVKHKMSPDEAAEAVDAYAKSQGASRRVDAAALSQFLQRAGVQ